MRAIKYADKKASLKRAMNLLYKELGPVEMMRVTAEGHEGQDDSVKRHRKLQATLDDEQCIREVLNAYRK